MLASRARSVATSVALAVGTALVVASYYGVVPGPLVRIDGDGGSDEAGLPESLLDPGAGEASLSSGAQAPAASGGNARTISIYKRTLASLDPLADAALLRDGFGLEVVVAERTFSSSRELCAERAAVNTLDGFQIHFFRSFVTAGCDLAEASYPERFATQDDGDPLPAVTFYAPAVAPFVASLRGANASFSVLKRGGLASLVTRLPGAGVHVEVVAEVDDASDAVDATTAGGASREACPAAFALDDSLDVLRAAYATYGGGASSRAAGGLPALLVATTTWPSLDATATPAFLALAAAPYGAALDVTTLSTDACVVSSTRFERISAKNPGGAFPGRRRSLADAVASQGDDDWDDAAAPPKTHLISVRSVQRRDVDTSLLEALTGEAADHHARYMPSPEAGWDAFLDSHVGLKFSDDMALDAALGAFAAEDGVYFHSHATGYAMDHAKDGEAKAAGSVWVAYAGDPWAFEIQGTYDAPPHAFSVIDYCSPSSVGDNTLNTVVSYDGAARSGGTPPTRRRRR